MNSKKRADSSSSTAPEKRRKKGSDSPTHSPSKTQTSSLPTSSVKCSSKKEEDVQPPQDNSDSPVPQISESLASETFPCDHCTETYETRTKLHRHVQDWHTPSGKMTLKAAGHIFEHAYERNQDGVFSCKQCALTWDTKSGYRTHMERTTCGLILVVKELGLSVSSFGSSSVQEPQEWRYFDQAVLHATGKDKEGETERSKALYYEEQIGRRPIGFSIDGVENNALVSREVFDSLPEQPFLAMVNKPTVDPDAMPQWQTKPKSRTPITAISDILSKSPCAKVVGTRNYKELSKNMAGRLNLNWTRYPQAGLVACCMLAGAIMYNVKSGEAILVNEVEAYGRELTEDSHREQMEVIKNVPKQNSVPSTTGDDYYEGVRPVTTQDNELRIGTNTSNLLVTSCVRLDGGGKAVPVSAGGQTMIFPINMSDIQDIRIFIDTDQASAAKSMVKKSITTITEDKGVESLRQLRTKFDQLDTYDLARCSGHLTARGLYRPLTVFTLADSGTMAGSKYGAGRIFNQIGKAVINKGRKATLSRDEVERDLEMCGKSKEMRETVSAIAELFGEETEILIIGNTALNKELEKLASRFSRLISDANEKVTTEIRTLFGV